MYKNGVDFLFGYVILWAVNQKKEEKKMKIQNIKNVEKFFEVVDSCKGTVELVTGEGDRLNLKSKLSQFVSLTNIFTPSGDVKPEIPEIELVAYDPEDTKKLIDYMMEGSI